jgi:iron transport multicopper oxidase
MLCSTATAVLALALASHALGKTVTYDWEVTWVRAAPDGFERSVIGINNQWPCPDIRASVGDTVVINLTNKLGNQTTGLHFHGINQISTSWMDGASMVSQCPVPPDMKMTYTFTVSSSHFAAQRAI